MNNDEELNEFMKENCKDCKEKCSKGIYDCKQFIRCVDKMITTERKQKCI